MNENVGKYGSLLTGGMAHSRHLEMYLHMQSIINWVCIYLAMFCTSLLCSVHLGNDDSNNLPMLNSI